MLLVANWADYLACCNVGIFLIGDRGSLDLLDYAMLTYTISTEENARQVTCNTAVSIRY